MICEDGRMKESIWCVFGVLKGMLCEDAGMICEDGRMKVSIWCVFGVKECFVKICEHWGWKSCCNVYLNAIVHG